jgi:ATP-dependent Clp protease protease subunit
MNTCVDEILVEIPEAVANMQLPDPILRNHYRDEQDRIFWLNDNVANCAEDLIYMILRCNREDKGKDVDERQPIKIFIDSPGGDMTFMWTIINMIETSQTPVWTINYCTAYSAAGDLLAAGHKRFALPGTTVMIHSGSCMYGGTVEQAESMKKYFDKLGKKVTDYFLSHTKIDPKMFKKKAPSDWYLDEKDMLEYGIIDEIITDLDTIL